MKPSSAQALWEARFRRFGRMGYEDGLVHRYDQPLRLRLLDRLVSPPRRQGNGRMRVLDLGCGTGDLVELLRRDRDLVVGVDLSWGALSVVRRRFAGRAGIALLVGSADAIPLVTGSIDLVTSVTVLQHLLPLARLKEALSEIRRVLTPAGRLVALEIAPYSGAVSGLEGTVVEEGLVERSVGAWLRVFAGSGFSVESVWPYAPVGTDSIRLLRRLLGRLGERAGVPPPTKDGERGAATRAGGRPLLRGGYTGVKLAMLAAAYPLDHWVGVQMPPRLAYYHAFQLAVAR